MIFDYPDQRKERLHAPSGYTSYKSYRPWLRDEFIFRCVYCLKRERWGQVTAEFDIDHFIPQTTNPQRRFDYINLVYSCRRCNSVKLDQDVDDPFQRLNSNNILALSDGSLYTQDQKTRRFKLQLDLNSPRLKSWRTCWMRILTLAEERDTDLYYQLVGFPDDLPDLSKLRPPKNDRKEGIEQSWFAKRQRDDLPDVY